VERFVLLTPSFFFEIANLLIALFQGIRYAKGGRRYSKTKQERNQNTNRAQTKHSSQAKRKKKPDRATPHSRKKKNAAGIKEPPNNTRP
jgi:hypothetical protein